MPAQLAIFVLFPTADSLFRDMVESVGKKLSQARLKRGLTIEEAAHATKLRPDKIIALESDDYSTLSEQHLRQGLSPDLRALPPCGCHRILPVAGNANPISVERLSIPEQRAARPKHSEPIKRRAPSAFPRAADVLHLHRGRGPRHDVGRRELQAHPAIGRHEQSLPRKTTLADQASGPQSRAPVAQTPAAPQLQRDVAGAALPTATPAPRVRQRRSTAGARPRRAATAPAAPTARLAGTATPAPPAAPKPRIPPEHAFDRDFVTPTVVPTPDPAAMPSPRSGLNEVLIASVKKTWVTMRKDDPKAAPIFEDYLYPNANPLKLKGARFFIDARDPALVQITKNGLPFAYQAPNVPVQ